MADGRQTPLQSAPPRQPQPRAAPAHAGARPANWPTDSLGQFDVLVNIHACFLTFLTSCPMDRGKRGWG